MGDLYGWGSNIDDRLGLRVELEDYLLKPIQFPFFKKYQLKVFDISQGESHVLAVAKRKDGNDQEIGEIYSWGLNLYGRLGFKIENVSDIFDYVLPKESGYQIIRVPYKIIMPEKITRVCCGNDFSACLTVTGKLYTWGFNKFGNLGLGDTIKSNMNFNYNDHEINNTNKDIKNGPNVKKNSKSFLDTEDQDLKSKMEGFEKNIGVYVETPMIVKKLADKRIIQIACGNKHMMALTDDRRVYSWGCGEYGKLGHINNQNISFPVLIEYLCNEDIIFIACGQNNSAAINSKGNLYCWGNGKYGKLGNGTYEDSPKPVKVCNSEINSHKIFYVSLGTYHTLCASCNLKFFLKNYFKNIKTKFFLKLKLDKPYFKK